MKKILLSFLLSVVALSMNAQLSISADSTFYNGFPKDSADHHALPIVTITNTSTTDSMIVSWQKESENLLAGWSIGGVCDKVSCYMNPGGVNTFVLGPTKSSLFYVGMIVDQQAANGCSSVRYKFTENLTTAVKYVAFKYCAWPTGTKDFENNNIVSIYPNPASNYVNITLNDKKITGVNVLNVIGRKIAHFDVDVNKSNSMRVPLDNISDGIYMLQFSDATGKMLGVRRITKQ